MALRKQRWLRWWSAKAKGRHSVLKPGPGAGKQDKGFWGLLFFKNTLKITCPKSDLCISTNRSQKALGYLEIIRLKFDNIDSAFPSICWMIPKFSGCLPLWELTETALVWPVMVPLGYQSPQVSSWYALQNPKAKVPKSNGKHPWGVVTVKVYQLGALSLHKLLCRQTREEAQQWIPSEFPSQKLIWDHKDGSEHEPGSSSICHIDRSRTVEFIYR